MKAYSDLGPGIAPAFRLGLATRGNTHPDSDDVLLALERGVNYWNWCGHEDGMSRAIRQLGPRRSEVVIATQISVADWGRADMFRLVERTIADLQCDWLDIVTLYYVESPAEWSQITRSAGAMRALEDAKSQGLIRAIGLTTHQRDLAAEWVRSRLLDVLMIRYNASHRGAELDVFPITDQLGLAVVCFTCLRWGELLKATAQDPQGFQVPPAPQWYRFVLSHPSVAVALMAPNDRRELCENLSLLDDWRPLSAQQREQLAAHGDRVREVAGPFP